MGEFQKVRHISTKEKYSIMEEFVMIDSAVEFFDWLEKAEFQIVKVIDE